MSIELYRTITHSTTVFHAKSLSHRRVPDGEKPESPAQSPGGGGSDWKDVAWDSAQIVPFPPHPVLPFEQERAKLSNPSVPSAEGETPPQPSKKYVSSEGWSYQTREGKNVIGYYPSWQWYKNNERSKPANMNFQKVDRVNFAFFQTDEDGNIWGVSQYDLLTFIHVLNVTAYILIIIMLESHSILLPLSRS